MEPASNHATNATPSLDGPSVFDRAVMSQYIAIMRNAEQGRDVTEAVEMLVSRLGHSLDELQCRSASGASAQSFALAKRVINEVMCHLLRASELSGSARESVGQLMGRTSVFDRMPHPRYHVTQDWFSNNIPTWESALDRFCGQPDVRYLEVGSFEGLSACFMLERVLTHETSRAVCIDPFDSQGQLQAERYFDYNVLATGAGHKVTKLKGYSRQVLPFLSGSMFDIAYVDGSHHPVDTLQDALSVWPLLRQGAILIFDDYGIGGCYPPEFAGSIDPKPGIDAFLAFIAADHVIVSKGWQVIVRKQ